VNPDLIMAAFENELEKIFGEHSEITTNLEDSNAER
jgi:hypothetical protein